VQLAQALGDIVQGIVIDPEADDIPEYESYEDDVETKKNVPEADDYDIDSYYKLISSKVMLP
jgi:hypothetical protein